MTHASQLHHRSVASNRRHKTLSREAVVVESSHRSRHEHHHAHHHHWSMTYLALAAVGALVLLVVAVYRPSSEPSFSAPAGTATDDVRAVEDDLKADVQILGAPSAAGVNLDESQIGR